MKKIRTFALAVALALAAFCLTPAAISAADKSVHIKGNASESGRVDFTGVVTEEGSGTLSHLGSFSYRIQGTGTVNNDGTYSGGGDITIVSGNGDRLSGPYTVTGTATDIANTGTAVITIPGGTGRFANASGTLTFISEGPPLRQDGQFFVFDIAETWDGEIVKGPKVKGPQAAPGDTRGTGGNRNNDTDDTDTSTVSENNSTRSTGDRDTSGTGSGGTRSTGSSGTRGTSDTSK